MPGFLYFLPNAHSSDIVSQLPMYGLTYLVDTEDKTLHARQCTLPALGSGVIIGDARNFTAQDVRYLPAHNIIPFPKSHAQCQPHLVYDPQQIPTPVDLQRTRMIPGQWLTMSDGTKWQIPNARVITDDGARGNLPNTIAIHEETGDWIAGSVVPRYRAIWDHATNYLAAMHTAIDDAQKRDDQSDPSIRFDIPNPIQMVRDAFATNYRIIDIELAAMFLLDEQIASKIADILVDNDGMERLQKKTAHDIGTT